MPDDTADSPLAGSGDRPFVPTAAPLPADRLARIVILAAGYSLTGIVGLSLAIPPGYATAVWPPSGIAVAALLLWGRQVWPGIWLGSFLVNTAVAFSDANLDAGATSLAVAASIGLGSTAQALVAAYLLERWIGEEKLFTSARATLGFTATATLCCLVASTWGVATLAFEEVIAPSAYLDTWQTWWLGDVIGILVFAPVFLTWRQSLNIGRTAWRIVETFAAFASLAIVTAIVFVEATPAMEGAHPMTFLPLPCLVWIACRFRPSGVALGACLVSAIAVAATANGTGPFAGDRSAHSMLLLQSFIGLTTVMGLTLAAAVAGTRQSVSELRNLSVEMEHLALSDELTGLRNRRGFLIMAEQALKLARRSQAKCALVFIDLDGLKRVNDTRGHAAGDAMITDAARVLTHVFRESDVVARVGGDEFAIFALLDEADGSTTIASRLQAGIDRFNSIAVPSLRLSMSFGIEELPSKSQVSLEELLWRADRAMYEKKRRNIPRRQATMH
jgi:diguanylate cyclase (GGDEF)-like protein